MGANLPLEWEQSSSRAASHLPCSTRTVLARPRSLSKGCHLGPSPAPLSLKSSQGSLLGPYLLSAFHLWISSLKAGPGWGYSYSKTQFSAFDCVPTQSLGIPWILSWEKRGIYLGWGGDLIIPNCGFLLHSAIPSWHIFSYLSPTQLVSHLGSWSSTQPCHQLGTTPFTSLGLSTPMYLKGR